MLYDGCSVHKTPTAVKTIKKYEWEPILNVAYSPDFNPIENYFGLIKKRFYKLKVNTTANPRLDENGVPTNDFIMEDMIERALEPYRDMNLKKIIERSE